MAIELIPDPDQGGFTARLPDIPAYGEGRSEEEAIADLKDSLRAYIGVFGIEGALSRLNIPMSLRRLPWNLESFVRE